MIIAGAGGHAKELLDVFDQNGFVGDLYLFDNINKVTYDKIYDKFIVIKNEDDLLKILIQNNEYVLGLGNPYNRKILSEYFVSLGGKLTSIMSSSARIGQYCIGLEDGLNIMNNVVIYSNVSIGKGSLINTACSIHHDVKIGEYCELSPGARILGNVQIGCYSFVGTNAVVLPNIKVGDNVVIGAGAIITNNIPSNSVVVGVPGKIIKEI